MYTACIKINLGLKKNSLQRSSRPDFSQVEFPAILSASLPTGMAVRWPVWYFVSLIPLHVSQHSFRICTPCFLVELLEA